MALPARYSTAFAGLVMASAIGCGGGSSTPGGTAGDPQEATGSSSEGVASTVGDTSDGGTDVTATGTTGTGVDAGNDGLTVQTDKGPIHGTIDSGVPAFLGIPYVEPPTGALRFRAPADKVAWTGTLETSAFGATCIQLATDGTIVPGGSEDCLTLNVWTPKLKPSGPLPVMAFIHGGYFVKGGASATWHGEEVYDGAELATRANVVVVTLQYRLGAFGFLADPALSTTDAPHGNYALLDQIAALKWVQRNIAQFGGDASNVTAWGQSAGGTSVAALLASPLASGLFARAAIESGGFSAYSVNTALGEANEVTQGSGCASAANVANCLRTAPAAAIAASLPNSALGPLRWHFIEDGVTLTDDPIDLFTSGAMNRVPVLLGNNRDELSAMIYDYLSADGLTKPTDQPSYEKAVTSMYGSEATAVLAQYPYAATASSPVTGLAQLVADDQYICPTRRAAKALSALTLPNGSPLPVWRYSFNHVLEAAGTSQYGAYHFLEIPFLFHALAPTDFTFSSDEGGLSLGMMGMWTRFAATGNPNGNGGPVWPAYKAATDDFLAIDVTSTAGQGIRTPQCDFWDTH